jgi:hypothetical protein
VRVLTVKSQAFEKKKDIIGAIRALDDGNQLLSEGQDKLLGIDSEMNLAQMFSKMGNRYRAVEMYPLLFSFHSLFILLSHQKIQEVTENRAIISRAGGTDAIHIQEGRRGTENAGKN